MNSKEFKHERKKINTKFLFVDYRYQRPVEPARVANIVKNFKSYIVREIRVSYRDGKYWIVDGHHTVEALIARNNGEDLMVNCIVFYGMTWLDEVEMFLDQAGDSRDVNIKDTLRAKRNSGDPDVTQMCKIAESVGFVIDLEKPRKGNDRILALTTLQKAYLGMTPEEFSNYLTLLKSTWGGASDSLCREMLQGMFIFYKTYKGMFKTAQFVKRLKKVSPTAIVRDGKVSASPGASKYARQILGYYNHHAKDRLPDLL